MNDILAGFTGGMTGLIVGHPLDTIKALIQTRGHTSIINSASIIFKQSNQIGFFRGLSLPFFSYGPINSILFVVYGSTLRLLNKGQPEAASLRNVYISGLTAGFISSFPKNPFELLKIQLQTHDRATFGGMMDCSRQIWHSCGVRGFFRGCSVLVGRDSFSFGLYFLTYEYLRRKMKNTKYGNNKFLIDIAAGGCAGGVAWFQVMPFDVVKSRLQANRQDARNAWQLVKVIGEQEGLAGFYKGLGPTVLRGFLVNAVILSVYSHTLNILDTN